MYSLESPRQSSSILGKYDKASRKYSGTGNYFILIVTMDPDICNFLQDDDWCFLHAISNAYQLITHHFIYMAILFMYFRELVKEEYLKIILGYFLQFCIKSYVVGTNYKRRF